MVLIFQLGFEEVHRLYWFKKSRRNLLHEFAFTSFVLYQQATKRTEISLDIPNKYSGSF